VALRAAILKAQNIGKYISRSLFDVQLSSREAPLPQYNENAKLSGWRSMARMLA
jgi:hypothetical protein